MIYIPTKSLLQDSQDVIYPITTTNAVYDNQTGESVDFLLDKKQSQHISNIITIHPSDWSIDSKSYKYMSDSIDVNDTIFLELIQDDNLSKINSCKVQCPDTQEQNRYIMFICKRIPTVDVSYKIAIFKGKV